MSVHFHPSHPNLLAVGCYDGSVAVFDARARGGAPLYQATVRGGKHSDAVWQVRSPGGGRTVLPRRRQGCGVASGRRRWPRQGTCTGLPGALLLAVAGAS
jgi:hypothetical protein